MGYKHKILNILTPSIRLKIKDWSRRREGKNKYNPKQIQSPIFESSLAAFDYYKCIFVHIPKNAGLSICYTLFGNIGGSHRKIIDYKKIFAPKTFKRYYKFTFVRNPWDRVVSTYFFLKNGGLTEKDKIWSEKHIGQFKTFHEFVKCWLTEENIMNSLHFQHQYCFVEDEKGNVAVDFIGRFETLEEDFQKIVKILNLERILKKTNTSIRKVDYRDYYDEQTKNIVAKVYEKDIRIFKYSF